jgi:hypothetical protein
MGNNGGGGREGGAGKRYIFDSGPLTLETAQAFERAYPKIKINLRGRGNDLGPRIVAERRAEKYLVDVFVGGKGSADATLYVGKVLDPIMSREGQIQVQKGRKERPRTGSNSLRIDIPKNDVPEENLRRAGRLLRCRRR